MKIKFQCTIFDGGRGGGAYPKFGKFQKCLNVNDCCKNKDNKPNVPVAPSILCSVKSYKEAGSG